MSLTGLLPGTTYYAHIQDSCGAGGYSAWVVDSFTTGLCTPVTAITVDSTTDTSVTFSFSPASGSVGYTYTVTTSAGTPSGGTSTADTTATVTGLTPGATYYIQVQSSCGGGSSSWIASSFTTSICDTVSGITSTSTDTSITFSFSGGTASGFYYIVDTSATAPAGGYSGYTFTTATSVSVASGLTAGTTYYLHILSSCAGGPSTWAIAAGNTGTCDAPVASVTTYGDTDVVILWTDVSGAAGYQYAISTSTTAPASGVNTTVTSLDTTGLPAGTYFVYVRTSCGGSAYSSWTQIPFSIAPCDTITGSAVSVAPTSTSASFTWGAESGVAGYYYIVNNSPSNPSTTTTGTYTTSPSATVTGLTDSTQYYLHIEVVCGAGAGMYSSWITVPFFTATTGVVNVNSNEFDVKAFPNPAINTVTVKVSGDLGTNRVVELTDITGKTLRKVNMTTDQVDVDLSDVAAAIYFIKYTDDSHTQVIKINKQ